MTYKELQERAKALGLPYVGVSKDELETSIQQAEAASNSSDTETSTTKPIDDASEANAAAVLNGNREIRRYTLEDHGKAFTDLANEFAVKKGYTIQMLTLEPKVACPACGHHFNP